MWGFDSSMDRNKSNLIFEKIIDKKITQKYYKNNNNKILKGADQYFLTDHVYPLLVDESSLPFPTKRNGTCFVGSASNFEKCMSPSIEQLKKFPLTNIYLINNKTIIYI